MIRGRALVPPNMMDLERLLKVMENPGIKVIAHYSFVSEPGGFHIVEVENLEELKPYLQRLAGLGVVNEVLPLRTHEDTLTSLENLIRKKKSRSKNE
jgi:hypothetical protein